MVLAQIEHSGVIAIIRADNSGGLLRAARALVQGGIRAVEFTLNTPDALTLIAEARQSFGDDIVVGAGTALTAEDVRSAVKAGAEFIIMPGLDEDAVKTAKDLGVVIIPGALTPSEAMTAQKWGADMIKIFPASLGGPGYMRSLLAPLPALKLVPTGGVSAANAGEYIRCGAAAVAVGGKMVSGEAIRDGEYHLIEAAAAQLISVVAAARMEQAV